MQASKNRVRELVQLIYSLRRKSTMCQGEETWKGNKMTVSVSVKSWHRLERRIQTSTASTVGPKGHQEMLISCGENPSYCV